jgi:glycine hydroxymethyltransferase
MHAVAAKAVALAEAARPEFAGYARQVIANAQVLAAGLAEHGMRPVSGGTDTHLVLLDLRGPGVVGRDAEQRCDLARITLNKNAIPFDPQPPTIASGIRVGTPSLTTQGMREPQMRDIAGMIARTVHADPGSEAGKHVIADVGDEVAELSARFPAYPVPASGR